MREARRFEKIVRWQNVSLRPSGEEVLLCSLFRFHNETHGIKGPQGEEITSDIASELVVSCCFRKSKWAAYSVKS